MCIILTLIYLYNMDRSKIVVLLDNGHGKNTPGKKGPKLENGKQLVEWSYVREIVKGIADKLYKEGIPYYLVHPENEEIGGQVNDLVLRTTRANSYHSRVKIEGKTTIFISVHVNAAGSSNAWTKASGWTVHIAKQCSANSLKLAQTLYSEAEKRGLKGNRSVPKERAWRNDYWVLLKTRMPAVLTENLFMDNKEDVEYLLSEEGKKAIIDLHVDGIKQYIDSL